MYLDLVKHLEARRPSKNEAVDLLGEPGGTRSAGLNHADEYLVYQIDLGQRICGMVFLNKLGVAFQKNGEYSHVTIWD